MIKKGDIITIGGNKQKFVLGHNEMKEKSKITIEVTREQFEFLIETLEPCYDRQLILDDRQAKKLQKLIDVINYSASRTYDNLYNEMIPKDTHKALEPIYEYIRKIKEKEPERAKRIAQICLELNIAIKKLDR